MKAEKKKELFKEFLSNNTILVVDKSSASRRRLTKTLVDLGSKRNQVHSVAHYSEAVDIIEKEKPQLVLSDYAINGGSGFDLFSDYRKLHPDEKKSTLILITSNISQSAVAKAAEEDVDSFIIKPYTVKSLEKSLVNAVINKLYPSEYVQTVDLGKEQMFAGDYAVAMETFQSALELNKKPALAHFYHGQCKHFLNLNTEAEGDYEKGLTINSIHFKCQVGLFDLFKKEGKHKEAYDVVRNIAKYFPSNPERLKEVIHLCMITKNYKDMELYYDIFVDLDERTDDVINFICSGLYIYGKYSLLQGDTAKTKEIFDKVGISCVGVTKFLKSMIILLVENDIYPDAQKLLSRFTMGADNKEDYEICSYLADSNTMANTERISTGLDLFNKGYKHPSTTKILIDSLFEGGSEKKALEYLEEAQHLWPVEFKSFEKKVA
jgi:CheY-like chemotaxis protein